MDAVTVARFVPPKFYGHPLELLPGVFVTLSPRGRDIRTQLTIREPLLPFVRQLIDAATAANPAALDKRG